MYLSLHYTDGKENKRKSGFQITLTSFFIVSWLALFNTIKLLTAEEDRLLCLVSNMLTIMLKALSLTALEAGTLKSPRAMRLNARNAT